MIILCSNCAEKLTVRRACDGETFSQWHLVMYPTDKAFTKELAMR